jgi:hypothetical protein
VFIFFSQNDDLESLIPCEGCKTFLIFDEEEDEDHFQCECGMVLCGRDEDCKPHSCTSCDEHLSSNCCEDLFTNGFKNFKKK